MHSETTNFPYDPDWAEELRPLLEQIAVHPWARHSVVMQQQMQALRRQAVFFRRWLVIELAFRASSPLPVPQPGSRAYRRLRQAVLAECRARCGVRQK